MHCGCAAPGPVLAEAGRNDHLRDRFGACLPETAGNKKPRLREVLDSDRWCQERTRTVSRRPHQCLLSGVAPSIVPPDRPPIVPRLTLLRASQQARNTPPNHGPLSASTACTSSGAPASFTFAAACTVRRDTFNISAALRFAQVRVGSRFCRRFASARALPSGVLGPVLRPPWNRQRRFPGSLLAWQGWPSRCRLAPH